MNDKIFFACASKVRYRKETSAIKARAKIGKKGHLLSDNFKPYKCQYCEGWHLGHHRRDIKQ